MDFDARRQRILGYKNLEEQQLMQLRRPFLSPLLQSKFTTHNCAGCIHPPAGDDQHAHYSTFGGFFTLFPLLTCQTPATLPAFRAMEKQATLHMARHCLLLHGCLIVFHPTVGHDMDSALSTKGTTWTWTSVPPLAEPAGTCLPLMGFKGKHLALPLLGPVSRNISKAQELKS